MTQPRKVDVKTVESPKTDWDEVKRRQERTENLIDQMRDAQRRLDKAVERATQKE